MGPAETRAWRLESVTIAGLPLKDGSTPPGRTGPFGAVRPGTAPRSRSAGWPKLTGWVVTSKTGTTKFGDEPGVGGGTAMSVTSSLLRRPVSNAGSRIGAAGGVWVLIVTIRPEVSGLKLPYTSSWAAKYV